ncbi:hypothetical protein C2G38_2029251 [Gigaspora rosea]|uniref:Uncharacterized protein n=1 Tax=Gigaspora rosea TaxID=44941 RepID=A0A397W1U0_9GLOM|nr:hypothetical protein C2G38_2029251 [Gigaspora rosea]
MGFIQTNRRNQLMSQKALDMSKLRAEMTWSHRQKLYFTELLSPRTEPEPEEPEKASDDYTSTEGFDKEEMVDSSSLVSEFGGFLDIWVETITNETEELANTESEDEEILEINDTVYPAVDSNAKWDLSTLFNDLELP